MGAGDLPRLKEDLKGMKDPIARVRSSMPTRVMPMVNLCSRVHLVSFLSGPTWTCCNCPLAEVRFCDRT
jgi:hypothetical protein